MVMYLLINEKAHTYVDKWQLFTSRQACLDAARKLGYGSSPFGEFSTLSDVPGEITQEIMGGSSDLDITMVPITVQGA